ncbi:MAG: aldo/keto reductase [Alphaproteobacteria bacterium]|nr:aldo/keto reductase [Alphaproteobacteria bacterium]
MKYNQMGRSGLFVSEICLGTMTFSGENFFGGAIGTLDQKASTKLVERSVAAGVNFLDTADAYSAGQSEVMTGQAIRDLGLRRSEIVLATKVFARMGPGVNEIGASRGHIMDGVARSLERLKTDYIDLYQIHQTDLVTPVEETMRALDDLVRQGMVRYIGVSNWTAWRIMKANAIAGARGQERFETVQAYYSLTGRELERELVPMMEEERIGCLVWSPLAGGYLSGKYSEGGEGGAEGRRKNFDFPPVDRARGEPIIAAMRPIAKAHNTSVARVALAWVLSKPFVTSMIIGARTLEQLDDNLEATKLTLTADEIAKLDELSAIAEDYPHWMITRFKDQRLPVNK